MPAIPKNTQQDFSIELRDIFGTLDTATTGAPTVNLCKDGTWAVATNAATNTKAGYWKVTLTAAEMNFREVVLEAVKTGFVTFSRTFYPEPDYTPTKATYLTGDAYTRLGAPVGASISADVAGVQADTDNIQTRIPAALVSGRMDSSVGAMSSAAVQAIWDAATSALTTVGSIGKWIVDKIDVVLSTRLASASYTAPLDAAGTRTAVGLASANLDTQLTSITTNQTTILDRIGAFTGSGVNTVLGFFRALLSKTATLPTDVGGTFDPTTDSTEAIRDRGDAAWTGGGSAPTAAEIATQIFGTETSGLTLTEQLRLEAALSGGKSSGFVAGSACTVTFRDPDDTKDVVVAVLDANGNRTSLTLDLT